MCFIAVNFDISRGKGPVRLSEKRIRLTSLSNTPIWGERVPNRGTLEIFRAMTRDSLSHVIPVKEQCGENNDDDELAVVQSARPEMLGPSNEAFRFSKASRSEDEDEDDDDDDKTRRNKQGNKR